jgi:hypothetical protein
MSYHSRNLELPNQFKLQSVTPDLRNQNQMPRMKPTSLCHSALAMLAANAHAGSLTWGNNIGDSLWSSANGGPSASWTADSDAVFG